MKSMMKFYSIVLTLFLFAGCKTADKSNTREGFVDVNGGKIWYKVIGEGNKTPVLLLHGGPGYPSYYLNELSALSKDRPVIFFDQLGCGRSDRISDTALMTVDNYVEQVKELLTALKIKDFYLYGHSWGTMLGTDFYLKHPEGIKAMILASPCLSAERWVKDADTLIASLPDSIQTVLNQSKKNIIEDTFKFYSAVEFYSRSFYTTKNTPSADLDSAMAGIGNNVYEYMWGNNEFFSTGTLKNFDRTADLKNIKVPTLYITGEHDAARPPTVKYYQSLTPNAKMAVIKNAGHMTLHDNPEADIKTISDFLNEQDKQ
jgi:proline iminopeptidase